MTLTPDMLLIVCPLALLAGFIDAIAGGGGMLVMPGTLNNNRRNRAGFLQSYPKSHSENSARGNLRGCVQAD